MRVVRFLILMVGLATMVAACAQQPVGYMVYPQGGTHPQAGAYPPAGGYQQASAYPPGAYQQAGGYPRAQAGGYSPASPPYGAGIDHIVYGTGGPYIPPRPAPGYVQAPSPAPNAAPPVAQTAPGYVGPPAPPPAVAAARPVRVASAVPMNDPMAAPVAAAPSAPPAPVARAKPVRVASELPVPMPAPMMPPGPVAMPAAPMAVPAGPVAAVPAGPVAYAPVIAPPDYTLDTGDRLRVVVFGQEGLTNAYLVDAAGCIDVPLIGQVLARGATTDELAHRIAARLRNGFIREPHVAVEVVAYRPFFILGEVIQPGQYPYVPRMTAETAVAIAGGFTPRAFRRNLTVDRPIAGRVVRMSVPPSFPIRPGDTVNVQERWF